MKLLKILIGLVVLLVGAFLVVGYIGDSKFDERGTYTVDAPVDKVWAVVSSPERISEWMPAPNDREKISRVMNIVAPKVASATATVATTGEAKDDVITKGVGARHSYIRVDGTQTVVEVAESVENKKVRERVISDGGPMASLFPEMSWGFELAEADGGAKTTLTPFLIGEASRPLGTVMHTILSKLGTYKGFQEQIVKGVEKAAKAPPPAPAK